MQESTVFQFSKETAKKGNSGWTTSFYTALREGYIKAAIMMKKLPLLNTTLIQLASLDPSNQHCEDTSSSLVRLAESLPQVIPVEKLGAVQQESKLLTIETKVSLSEDTDPADCHFRLDSDWWCKIFQMRESGQIKYALLSSLVKALLSIFSGPLVENTFTGFVQAMEFWKNYGILKRKFHIWKNYGI